jgi:hypothetical protein
MRKEEKGETKKLRPILLTMQGKFNFDRLIDCRFCLKIYITNEDCF